MIDGSNIQYTYSLVVSYGFAYIFSAKATTASTFFFTKAGVTGATMDAAFFAIARLEVKVDLTREEIIIEFSVLFAGCLER